MNLLNPLPYVSFLTRLGLLLGVLTVWLAPLHAQSPATGVLEGRIFNSRRGEYVEKARVTIQGSRQETFTDSTGQYRITNVPAGPVTLQVFYTGLGTQIEQVSVVAGQIVQQARAANPAIRIIARAHSDAEVDHLKSLGADLVIMGEREIALGIIQNLREWQTRA